ncbi:MAG: hypothetical protein IJP20_02480 [Clostridia bacterium]|nr:hypothetical protein [Clostridia bacterium]
MSNTKRKRRFGDRKEGRKLRTLDPIKRAMPYIMPKRSDSQNYFTEKLDIAEAEKFCREQIKAGRKNFSLLHVIIAAYIRVVSQRPAINRFVSGQTIYARNNIEVLMTIKKKMTLESEDACIKVVFEPTDTVYDVYDKFNKIVEENKGEGEGNATEDFAKILNYIPRFLLRFVIWFIKTLDYYGILPKFILDLSPFHGSMIITSLGSLGIRPIYHHIYDFGNLPVFVAYGAKQRGVKMNDDGEVVKYRYIEMKVTTDERICDGYYYASAFKMMKRIFENPSVLEYPPEQVVEDID